MARVVKVRKWAEWEGDHPVPFDIIQVNVGEWSGWRAA